MTSTHSKPSPSLPGLSRPIQMLLATLTVAVAITASMAQTAFAQPAAARGGMPPMGDMRGGPGGMMGGRHMGRVLDLVGATADQRAQIKTIMDAAHADIKTQRDSGRSLHQQMEAAFAQPTVDARTVEALRLQISALHEAGSKRMTQALLDISKVLTPDQRKTLADAMAKRKAMMERHAAERAALEKATTK